MSFNANRGAQESAGGDPRAQNNNTNPLTSDSHMSGATGKKDDPNQGELDLGKDSERHNNRTQQGSKGNKEGAQHATGGHERDREQQMAHGGKGDGQGKNPENQGQGGTQGGLSHGDSDVHRAGQQKTASSNSGNLTSGQASGHEQHSNKHNKNEGK